MTTEVKDLHEARKAGAQVYVEFANALKTQRDNGLVDCKMKVFAGPETTAAGVVQTLTNVLRLVEANKARPLILS